MKELEIERVYLLKRIPLNLFSSKFIEVIVGEFYDSNSKDALKIRKKGNNYELIKKDRDNVVNTEHKIEIKKEEFDILIKSVVQIHKKIRYFYEIEMGICEIDFYQGKLLGYARVEIEFKDMESMEKFSKPDWFGEEISSINHEIHENLGLVSFEDMKQRYFEKGIELKAFLLN